MCVQAWFAIVLDVSGKGQNFDLFLNRYLDVLLLLSVKKSHCDFAESSDATQVCISEPACSGELKQTFPDFVAFLEHDGECSEPVLIVRTFASIEHLRDREIDPLLAVA